MFTQDKIIKITAITSIIFLIIFTIFHFLAGGFTTLTIQQWFAQIGISICTSAFVTTLVAIVSYRQMKRDYFTLLAKDFRRLFNIIDDYLCIQRTNKLYFEEYYSLRDKFLDYVMTAEQEGVNVSKKEEEFLTPVLNELYLIPNGLLYYSYQYVKAIENSYLAEKNPNNSKVIAQYKARLDQELDQLNNCLLILKLEDKYNTAAFKLYEMAKIKDGEMKNIDEFENKYRTKFYEDDQKYIQKLHEILSKNDK